jgi:hypothetical protein
MSRTVQMSPSHSDNVCEKSSLIIVAMLNEKPFTRNDTSVANKVPLLSEMHLSRWTRCPCHQQKMRSTCCCKSAAIPGRSTRARCTDKQPNRVPKARTWDIVGRAASYSSGTMHVPAHPHDTTDADLKSCHGLHHRCLSVHIARRHH